MTIERNFDIPLVASLALKEKQIQQNYRPIIAVHKWFARRPGTLFRGLLLSEFSNKKLVDTFFSPNNFAGRRVADPFMGGGTPLIEANRVGCDVIGYDINPMAAWIVREEIEHLDHDLYQQQARALVKDLEREIGALYQTDCPKTGEKNLPVKYFLWVKTTKCETCRQEIDLFPGYLISEDKRHPLNVLVCSGCGELNEVADLKEPGCCSCCQTNLVVKGPAQRNKCTCPFCGSINKYPRSSDGPLRHRLFAIEYANPAKKGQYKGRLFKKPDAKDLARVTKAEERWRGTISVFAPDEEILRGDESDRLHRWGYTRYSQLFNARQLLGLELSCQLISKQPNERIRKALATNLSDLLRYQNMLCRYDTMALKSLDIFSIHGFPVGLVHCESNLLGIVSPSGLNVGSGGWTNIIEKYAKAKRYCDAPFEVQQRSGKKVQVPVPGEWIGEAREGAEKRDVSIICGSSAEAEIPPQSLDAVFTDPPYIGNVQYAELMDFCFAWLRRLAGSHHNGFGSMSTRNPDELTVNVTAGRDLAHFTEGLAKTFTVMARALKRGAPLAFTYHHNKIEAYLPIGVAILDSGLTCSASLPCPAEMGGSIHISGTGSSIIDTVFVSRHNGETAKRSLFTKTSELIPIVVRDLGQLRLAGVRPTAGDIRCIAFGHMTRMAIWSLRSSWDTQLPTAVKLQLFGKIIEAFGNVQDVIDGATGVTSGKSEELSEFIESPLDAVAF